MKKILLINGGKKKFGTDFLQACKSHNITCKIVRLAHMAFLIDNTTTVFVLGSELYLEDIRYAFLRVRGKYQHASAVLTRILETQDIPYNDNVNKQHTNATEKTIQSVLLARAGVPMPKTLLIGKDCINDMRLIVHREIQFPCVVKVDGSQGDSVWKVDSSTGLYTLLDSLENKLIIVQEYLENEYDLRVLLFYGEVIGAIKRSSTDGFYNNVSKGGHIEKFDLSEEDIDIAKRAAAAVGGDFCGVDLMHTRKGIVVIEVNIGPQVYGFEGAHDISIGKTLVKRIDHKFLK